jgi:hypothetical protein
MTDVSLHAARGFRMLRQHLIERAPQGHLLEAVEAVHGIQAQIAAHARFAAAQRIEKCKPADIDRALWTEKSLVKTWAMRGTVHWLPASEEPIFVSAMRAIREPRYARWWAQLGLTKSQVDQLYAAAVEALAAGPMTRQELGAAVVPVVGEWAGPYLTSSWGGAIKGMCASGLVVFGPSRGTNVTFVRRDLWDTLGPIGDSGPAMVEILRRYLRSFGPATLQDAAYWTGGANRDLRPHWDALEPELAPVRVNGDERWILAADLAKLTSMEDARLPVRLLPAFDPLLLAHREKTDLLPERWRKRIYGAAAWVYPVVLVDGAIAGKWQYERTAKQMIVTVEPFRKIKKAAQRAIEQEAQHLAQTSDRTAQVRYLES